MKAPYKLKKSMVLFMIIRKMFIYQVSLTDRLSLYVFLALESCKLQHTEQLKRH
jgi:hypothetical protein